MARHHRSDSLRATVAAIVALPIAFATSFGVAATDTGPEPSSLIGIYLAYWPAFTVIYLVWTHVAYSRQGPGELDELARRERASRNRWWNRVLGAQEASSLTLVGAGLAVVLTVVIAQTPQYRSNAVLIVLGLLTVAASWALMVYSFALDYLLLDTELRRTGQSHIEFHLGPTDSRREFGDYLTFTVLLSTMGASTNADVPARAVWRRVRVNVVVAFGFNSVVVAMVVSLLFGGLAS